jgi:hypothetical protein
VVGRSGRRPTAFCSISQDRVAQILKKSRAGASNPLLSTTYKRVVTAHFQALGRIGTPEGAGSRECGLGESAPEGRGLLQRSSRPLCSPPRAGAPTGPAGSRSHARTTDCGSTITAPSAKVNEVNILAPIRSRLAPGTRTQPVPRTFPPL